MIDLHKRRLLQLMLATLAAALPVIVKASAGASRQGDQLPPGLQPVSERDPLANAMGFRQDANRVDPRYFPTRRLPAAQNEFCANCRLFRHVEGPWGRCTVMIPKGVVNAAGWCGRWTAPVE